MYIIRIVIIPLPFCVVLLRKSFQTHRHSVELQTCKRVGIELKESKTVVDLFQKDFSINQNGSMHTYKPGEYPEPCQMEIPNVEIFQVGLFLVVRIYQPRNPRVINFEVGDWCQLKIVSS